MDPRDEQPNENVQPWTREQVEHEFSLLYFRLQSAGRAVGIATGHGDIADFRATLEPETADAIGRAGLEIQANARAAFIRALDGADRLADCDRDELVAEADFLLDRDED